LARWRSGCAKATVHDSGTETGLKHFSSSQAVVVEPPGQGQRFDPVQGLMRLSRRPNDDVLQQGEALLEDRHSLVEGGEVVDLRRGVLEIRHPQVGTSIGRPQQLVFVVSQSTEFRDRSRPQRIPAAQKKTKDRTTTFLRQGAPSDAVGSMHAV
jgi:hypothetical protein